MVLKPCQSNVAFVIASASPISIIPKNPRRLRMTSSGTLELGWRSAPETGGGAMVDIFDDEFKLGIKISRTSVSFEAC